jgi:hypothetical protein
LKELNNQLLKVLTSANVDYTLHFADYHLLYA